MLLMDFLPFLGHSSINAPFDEFLNAKGIKWRPKVGRRLDTLHFIPSTGLALSFDLAVSSQERGISPKSEGNFVFTRLDVMIVAADKKDGSYGGPLIRGLVAQDTRQLIEAKLGQPRRRNAESDNFYLDELVWTVAFERGKLNFLQFDLPSDGWRAHGICP